LINLHKDKRYFVMSMLRKSTILTLIYIKNIV